jgi:death on curing protein
MAEIRFLTLEEVYDAHRQGLEEFGGSDGAIDASVIESAAAQPQARMFGQYLHVDVAHMAAAYLYHFAASQGFIDGNKRTAVICTIAFLTINGYDLDATPDELYDLTMRVANGQAGKADVADWMRDRLSPKD